MVAAYQCFAIIPCHKCYIPIQWGGKIFPDHCTPFGLTTSGNIQGLVADALVDILHCHGILNVVKWVDDFNIFRFPSQPSKVSFTYDFDLSSLFSITDPLGIHWHSVEKKGHDFASTTEYGGFVWDLPLKRVTVSDQKHRKYKMKVLCFTQN